MAPTYLALAPSDPHTPTRSQKVLSNAPYAPPKRNPPLQKFAQYILRAKLHHDERHSASRHRERSHRREQRAHECRMVDAVHDEQHIWWVIADIDLTLRREGPVKSRYCDGCGGSDGASGRRGYRDQVFTEERDERGNVRRHIPARQGSKRERKESRSGAGFPWI